MSARSLNLLQIFKQLVRLLLQGKALHIEDIVDALTLRDNYDSLENYATALHLLSRDQVRTAHCQEAGAKQTHRACLERGG